MFSPRVSLSVRQYVQNLHIAGSDKPVEFSNLDVITFVGYRVKSIQGTRFRQEIWGQSRYFHCSPGMLFAP